MSASFRAAVARFECRMGTQAAQNWLLLVNVICVGLYVFLTWKLVRWPRKQWALDRRKEEWGELIATLTKCFPKIEIVTAVAPHVFAAHTPQWAARQEGGRWALLEARGVINNRLFITDVLERERVREDWKEIELMTDRAVPANQGEPPAGASSAGLTDLQQKWVALHRKLVRLAQADLGIATGGSDAAHG
jgi:hypothetical protein